MVFRSLQPETTLQIDGFHGFPEHRTRWTFSELKLSITVIYMTDLGRYSYRPN